MKTIIVAGFALFMTACSAGNPPPTIADMGVFLATMRCPDGRIAVTAGCAGAAPERASDQMIERRWDWAHSDGAQIEDAYALDDGSGWVNTFSYPPHGPFVAANGDGGDVMVSDGTRVRINYTQNGTPNGGTVAGWWVGPKCGGTGWLSFDNAAPTGSWRRALATLAGSTDPNACPNLNSAYTQWRLESAAVPFLVRGTPQSLTLPVVISEHYAGLLPAAAASMERIIMAQGVGRVMWEAWSKTPPGTTWSCPGIAPWSNPPGPGWYLQDRRCITAVAAGTTIGDSYGWPPAAATQ